jgi:hypothetical protein
MKGKEVCEKAESSQNARTGYRLLVSVEVFLSIQFNEQDEREIEAAAAALTRHKNCSIVFRAKIIEKGT